MIEQGFDEATAGRKRLALVVTLDIRSATTLSSVKRCPRRLRANMRFVSPAALCWFGVASGCALVLLPPS